MNMRSILLGGVALLALGSVVSAADLGVVKAPRYDAPPVGFNWTGIYIGLDAGGAFSAKDVGLSATGPALAGLQDPGVIGSNSAGAMGGGHIGFNYQIAPVWVLGVEAGIAATGLTASGTDTVTGTTFTHSIPWTGSVVGKVGLLVEPRLMVYGLGGVAFGEIKESASTLAFMDPTTGVCSGICAGTLNNTHTGWTAGAGVEYAFTPNLFGGLEYRYVDLGSHGIILTNSTTTVPTAVFTPNTTAAWNEVRLKLGVKF